MKIRILSSSVIATLLTLNASEVFAKTCGQGQISQMVGNKEKCTATEASCQAAGMTLAAGGHNCKKVKGGTAAPVTATAPVHAAPAPATAPVHATPAPAAAPVHAIPPAPAAAPAPAVESSGAESADVDESPTDQPAAPTPSIGASVEIPAQCKAILARSSPAAGEGVSSDQKSQIAGTIQRVFSGFITNVTKIDAIAQMQKSICKKGNIGNGIISIRSFEGRLANFQGVAALGIALCSNAEDPHANEDFALSGFAIKALDKFGVPKTYNYKSQSSIIGKGLGFLGKAVSGGSSTSSSGTSLSEEDKRKVNQDTLALQCETVEWLKTHPTSKMAKFVAFIAKKKTKGNRVMKESSLVQGAQTPTAADANGIAVEE